MIMYKPDSFLYGYKIYIVILQEECQIIYSRSYTTGELIS
jgi:hypothetical protein